jgi:hypothetical protein
MRITRDVVLGRLASETAPDLAPHRGRDQPAWLLARIELKRSVGN